MMVTRSVRPFACVVAVGAAFMVSTAGMVSSGAATRASTGAATAKPVVIVTPDTGLVDLQNVTVTGTGFSANVQVGTVECRPGATAEPDCDLGTLVYSQTDSHGKFSLSRYVRRLFSVNGKTIDCGATAGCILGAGNVSNLKQASGSKIFFNPKIPPKVPTITVSPNTKLVDHQLVSVTGKGYAPSTTVYLSQCVAHPPLKAGQVCDYSTQRYVNVDSNGTFTATNVVLERRQIVFTPTGTQTLDCGEKPGMCDIQAGGSGLGTSTTVDAPLSFARYVKPAVAAVQLSPSSALQDLQPVTLTGTGFTPGYAVNVQECALTGTKVSSCDYTTSRAATAGFQGQFTLTYFVRRDLTAFVSPTGPNTIDCATTACELTVQGTPSQPTTTVALTFDPNVPAVTPTISANPNTSLTDNQSISVSLNGFTPGQPVQVIECSADAISETNGLSYCDYTTGQIVTPTGTQPTQTTFVVRAVLNGQDGLQDCTTQPGACILIASEGNGFYGGGIPIGVIAVGPSQPGIASTPLTFTTP